jgi:hypothetical protein
VRCALYAREAIVAQGSVTPARADGQWPLLAAEALPFGIVSALVAFMIERDGAIEATIWYPVALVLLAAVVVVRIAAGWFPGGSSRASLAAVGCLTAFVFWGFATIAWAAVRGDAWDGSNKALFYLLAFALLATWPVSARALWPVVLLLAAVVALEGVITVEQFIRAEDPSEFGIGTRLSEPLGYPNATAALFMIMFWLMVGLASRPWLPVAARAAAFGLAGLHATLNLLTESRGSLYTLPAVAIAYFLVVPGRLRSLAVLCVIALGFGPTIRPTLRVYGAEPEQFSGDLRYAIELGLVSAGILVVAGLLFALLDDRLRLPPRAVRLTGAGVLAALMLVAVALVGVYKPWQSLDSAWHSFRYEGEPGGSASHFGGLGSNRYDLWKVGLIEFKNHPLQGIGVDNYLVPYLQQRQSGEQPLYPHSLAVRILSQTGLVGAALFAAFLTFVFVAALGIRADRERELAGVLLAGALVWLLHGLVDWLWELPALGLLGTALLGAACGLSSWGEERAPRPRVVLAAAAAASVLTVAAAASLTLPWLAERDVNRAASLWPQDAPRAFALLDRARRLNPLSDRADVVGGAIASRLRLYPQMRARFANAVVRSPDDWYANLELGIAASLVGDRSLASASLRRAERLNPHEPVIQTVLRRFRSGRRIDPDAVDRAFSSESG